MENQIPNIESMIKLNDTFSFSRLDTYNQCGFKYKLIYVDKHYIYTGSIATEFGTLVHETEEAIAKAIQQGQPIDYTQLKTKFIRQLYVIQYKYAQDYAIPDKASRTYEEKAYEYLESGIYRLEAFMRAHPTYKIVGIEQKFKYQFEDRCHFKGAIDRVFYDTATDTYLIQDIKTYAEPVEKEKLATPLQFVVYTLAVKDLYKCTSEQITCQYDLPLCNVAQDAGTNGFMNRGIKKINKLFDSINLQDFEPSPSPLCHWCAFCPTNQNQVAEAKNLCPYYSLWTKERKTFQVASDWKGLENHQQVLENYIEGGEK